MVNTVFTPFFYNDMTHNNLPDRYEKDKITAMVRDPWWIFVYWEITPGREKAVKEQIIKRGQSFEKTILRVYDVTGSRASAGDENVNGYFDIILKDMARKWYIDVKIPKRSWRVDIGILTAKGDFHALAKSNVVTTPSPELSGALDPSFKYTGSIPKEWLFSRT
jgi:uncharacterized protein